MSHWCVRINVAALVTRTCATAILTTRERKVLAHWRAGLSALCAKCSGWHARRAVTIVTRERAVAATDKSETVAHLRAAADSDKSRTCALLLDEFRANKEAAVVRCCHNAITSRWQLIIS